MKAHKCVILVTLSCVLFVFASILQADGGTADWEYTITPPARGEPGYVTLTQYKGSGGTVTTPAEIEGLPVKILGSGSNYLDPAFKIVNLTVSQGVKLIKQGAFQWHKNLETIRLNDDLETLGHAVFAGTEKLKYLTIPDSVQSTGTHTFAGSKELREVVIGAGLSKLELATLADCRKLTNIVIPPNIQEIGDYTFHNCTGLENLVISEGVKKIDFSAVRNCSALTTLSIPDSVEFIAENAFMQCMGLTRLYFGSGLVEVGIEAFMYLDSLEAVTIPPNLIQIPTDMFYDNGKLKSVIIGESVEGIGDTAFAACVSLDSVLFLGDAPPIATGVEEDIFEGLTPKIFYLPKAIGWGEEWYGLTAYIFLPKVEQNGLSANAHFVFSWTGTGAIPMNVERNASLNVLSWETLETGNDYGSFEDLQTPSKAAFYRVKLDL